MWCELKKTNAKCVNYAKKYSTNILGVDIFILGFFAVGNASPFSDFNNSSMGGGFAIGNPYR